MKNEEHKVNGVVYYPACCWGLSAFGVYLWGTVLVLGGGLWLLHNLSLIPAGWSGLIGPPLLIVVGLACLISTRRPSWA